MYLIINHSTDAAYNLAAEEYLLTRMREDVIMLWRNDNAVIIGRNQNTLEEINPDYVEEHHVKVIRRMTGGGAVYHDLGNINFTFIENHSEGLFNDYRRFTAPIRDYLRTLGVDAQLSGRNDLTLDGMKVSGNAQTVRQGRIMHHGTLLYSSNMSGMDALRPRAVKIESKGVKSVRSRVANISSHLKDPVPVTRFMQNLGEYFLSHVEGILPYCFSSEDDLEIRKLVEEKYGTWEWNYGSSPRYNLERSQKYDYGIVDLRMNVEGGRIAAISIYGDFFGMQDKSVLEQALIGVKHQRQAVLDALAECDIGTYIHGMTKEQFADLLC